MCSDKDIRMSVTLVIPFFNRRDFIKEKYLELLKFSDMENLETIFVNDGSNQEFNFLVNHKNITVVNLEKNLGVQKARNIGLQQAKKEFIIFFDSDDQLCLNTLIANIHQFRSNFGYCTPKISYEDGTLRNSRFSFVPKFSMSPVPTSFLAFNRLFLLRRGIKFDETLTSCQDDDIFLTCKRHSYPVKYKFSWGFFYNHNEPRITNAKNYRSGRDALLKKHRYLNKNIITKLETCIYFSSANDK